MTKRPWTVVTYNFETYVTKVTNMLESSIPDNAKLSIESRIMPEERVVAIVPGHHADWSASWWVPAERSLPLNCN